MEEISDARWRIVKKDYFMQQDAKVNCAAFHASSGILVVGFSNGLFGLYDLPDFNMVHLLRYFPPCYAIFGRWLGLTDLFLVFPRAILTT